MNVSTRGCNNGSTERAVEIASWSPWVTHATDSIGKEGSYITGWCGRYSLSRGNFIISLLHKMRVCNAGVSLTLALIVPLCPMTKVNGKP